MHHCYCVTGEWKESPGKGQALELHATEIQVATPCHACVHMTPRCSWSARAPRSTPCPRSSTGKPTTHRGMPLTCVQPRVSARAHASTAAVHHDGGSAPAARPRGSCHATVISSVSQDGMCVLLLTCCRARTSWRCTRLLSPPTTARAVPMHLW